MQELFRTLLNQFNLLNQQNRNHTKSTITTYPVKSHKVGFGEGRVYADLRNQINPTLPFNTPNLPHRPTKPFLPPRPQPHGKGGIKIKEAGTEKAVMQFTK